MSSGFPCPNPTCTHVFSAQAVQGAASLTCPRCGSVFQFRQAPAPAPAPAKKAAAAPVSRERAASPGPAGGGRPVPVAVPVPRAESPRSPEPPAAEPPSLPDLIPPADFTQPTRVRAPRRKGGRRYLVLALGGVFVLLLLGVVIVVLPRMGSLFGRPGAQEDRPVGAVHESTLYNYRYQMPPRPWVPDERTKADLRTNLALRRTDPNSWLAILAYDYKTRTPQDAEMVDEGIRRLKNYFREHFEWEAKPEDQLGGLRAQRLEFVGQINSVEMSGECFMLASKGVGYWFLTWTPAADRNLVAEEWPGLRRGFTLLKERDGWVEKQPRTLTLKGVKGDYTLGYTEGIWEQQDKASAYDPDADTALLGRDATDPDATDKTATALVLLLPKQDDLKAAVTTARQHVEAQQKKLYPETNLSDADKGVAEDRPPEEVGNTRGRILKLRSRNGDGYDHFVYLAVVQQPEQVLAIQCECDMRRRIYWEVNFAQLVRKFHSRGK